MQQGGSIIGVLGALSAVVLAIIIMAQPEVGTKDFGWILAGIVFGITLLVVSILAIFQKTKRSGVVITILSIAGLLLSGGLIHLIGFVITFISGIIVWIAERQRRKELATS